MFPAIRHPSPPESNERSFAPNIGPGLEGVKGILLRVHQVTKDHRRRPGLVHAIRCWDPWPITRMGSGCGPIGGGCSTP